MRVKIAGILDTGYDDETFDAVIVYDGSISAGKKVNYIYNYNVMSRKR